MRSSRFSVSPARSRITTSAICRSDGEIFRICPSSRFSAYGPSSMPAASIPMMPGRRSLLHSAFIARPDKKISARDVSI